MVVMDFPLNVSKSWVHSHEMQILARDEECHSAFPVLLIGHERQHDRTCLAWAHHN